MNRYKARILMILLVFVLLCLVIVCIRLERETPSGQGNTSTPGISVSENQTASDPSPTQKETSGETTEDTTVATTAETTEVTTIPTTEATTVPETTQQQDVSIGANAAALAAEQIGKPYKYGTSGPDSFDTSGLLYYCYAEYGVSVPRSTSGQADFGYLVEKEDIQPGDAVFFWSSNPGTPEYVGIYLGNGIVVASLNPSKPIIEFNMYSTYYTEHYVFARRFY